MKKNGFTIIELLIVVAVISILAAISIPRYKAKQMEVNLAKTKAELRTLQAGVESYYSHNKNVYPKSLDVLTKTKPLIADHVLYDPFQENKPFSYQTDQKSYVIYSVGPDGNGSATIEGNAIIEKHGDSCMFVSNVQKDTSP